MKYVMVVDEGTTNVRAIIVNNKRKFVSQAFSKIPIVRPYPEWSEQDPEVIWKKTVQVIKKAMSKKSITARDVVAVGITNQRTTNLL